MDEATMPTTLHVDGLDREVVTAIYTLPLYGGLAPTWICVVRWERPAPGELAEFLVFTVTQPCDATYRAENKAGAYDLARAHAVAWQRAANRYGLT